MVFKKEERRRRERNPGPEENYGPEIKSNHDGNILFKDGIGEKCKSETTLRVNSDKEGLERKENTSSDQGPVKNIYRSSELENGEERRNPVQLYSEYPCEHIQHDPNLTPDLSQAVTRRRRRIPTLLILSFIKLIDLSFHGIMLSLFLYSTYLSAIYCTQGSEFISENGLCEKNGSMSPQILGREDWTMSVRDWGLIFSIFHSVYFFLAVISDIFFFFLIKNIKKYILTVLPVERLFLLTLLSTDSITYIFSRNLDSQMRNAVVTVFVIVSALFTFIDTLYVLPRLRYLVKLDLVWLRKSGKLFCKWRPIFNLLLVLIITVYNLIIALNTSLSVDLIPITVFGFIYATLSAIFLFLIIQRKKRLVAFLNNLTDTQELRDVQSFHPPGDIQSLNSPRDTQSLHPPRDTLSLNSSRDTQSLHPPRDSQSLNSSRDTQSLHPTRDTQSFNSSGDYQSLHSSRDTQSLHSPRDIKSRNVNGDIEVLHTYGDIQTVYPTKNTLSIHANGDAQHPHEVIQSSTPPGEPSQGSHRTRTRSNGNGSCLGSGTQSQRNGRKSDITPASPESHVSPVASGAPAVEGSTWIKDVSLEKEWNEGKCDILLSILGIISLNYLTLAPLSRTLNFIFHQFIL